VLAHACFFACPVIGPLILWRAMLHRSTWVRMHAGNAFDFQVTYNAYFVVLLVISFFQRGAENASVSTSTGSSDLIDFLIGWPVFLLPVVLIVGLVQTIYRLVDAHDDRLVPYRWSLRLLGQRP
jgi:uncharacterized Tic20 family protein